MQKEPKKNIVFVPKIIFMKKKTLIDVNFKNVAINAKYLLQLWTLTWEMKSFCQFIFIQSKENNVIEKYESNTFISLENSSSFQNYQSDWKKV